MLYDEYDNCDKANDCCNRKDIREQYLEHEENEED